MANTFTIEVHFNDRSLYANVYVHTVELLMPSKSIPGELVSSQQVILGGKFLNRGI